MRGKFEADKIDIFERGAIVLHQPGVQSFAAWVGEKARARLVVDVKLCEERFKPLCAHVASDGALVCCFVRPRRSARRARSSWLNKTSIGGSRPARSRITVNG